MPYTSFDSTATGLVARICRRGETAAGHTREFGTRTGSFLTAPARTSGAEARPLIAGNFAAETATSNNLTLGCCEAG
jgi:hypothetical protein